MKCPGSRFTPFREDTATARPSPVFWGARSLFIVVLLLGCLVLQPALPLATPVASAQSADSDEPFRQRFLLAIGEPSEAVIHEVAASPLVEVVWCESGLILGASSSPGDLPKRWGALLLAAYDERREFGILRTPEIQHLRVQARENRVPGNQTQAQAHNEVLLRLSTMRLTELRTRSGPLWVLQAPPGEWPPEVLGCHGGLIRFDATSSLPRDPRSLLDDGPPLALLPSLRKSASFGAGEQRLLASVTEDSILTYWNALIRNSIGLAADRWVFGTDLDALYLPRVRDIMSRHLNGIAGSAVELQAFDMERGPFTSEPQGSNVVDPTSNVVGRIPGSVPGTGVFVVCGHVDATGSQSGQGIWTDRETNGTPGPTPGAEDNASGVACMLEVMRCVADGVRSGTVSFAFDLEFIAFSGEEAEGVHGGLVGSSEYVAARVAEGKKLLGAFNMDMVGSDSLGNNLQVVHNPSSRWMAELLIEQAQAVQPAIDLSMVLDLDESLSSDHNSFWTVNVDAIMGSDAPVNVLRDYASYHKTSDVGNDVSPAKMVEVTRAMLAGLLRFNENSGDASDLVVRGDAVFLRRNEDFPYHTGQNPLWPGGPLQATISLQNAGGTYQGDIQVDFFVDNATRRRPVQSFTLSAVTLPPGDREDFLVQVPILREDVGTSMLVAEVTTAGNGAPDVRTFSSPFEVAEQAADAGLQLSPTLVSSFEEIEVSFQNLLEPGTFSLDFYNLEGEKVFRDVQDIQPTINSSVRRVFLATGPNVSPGVYFVQARLQTATSTQVSRSRVVILR